MPEISTMTMFFATMLLLFLCLLVYFRFDIFEPAALLVGTMALSAFFAMLTQERWSLVLTDAGYFSLTCAMLSVAAAGVFCSWRLQPPAGRQEVTGRGLADGRGGWAGALILLVLVAALLGMAWMSLQELYAASLEYGNQAGISGILPSLRPAVEAQRYTFSRWFSYRQMAAQAVATVSCYIFLRRLLFAGWQWKNVLYLVPVAAYVPFMIFTTGRMTMMCFGIFILLMAAILYEKKKGFRPAANARVFCGTLFFAAAVLGTFLLMGFLTGKAVSEDRTPFVILAHYIGLSVPAFGEAAAQPLLEDGYLFSNTFLGFYRALAQAVAGFPKVDTFLPFVYFDDIDTNVYTAQWRYLLDFGHVGMCVFAAVLCGGYTLVYHYVKYHSDGAYGLMLYATLAYPLFLSSIDERFLVDLAWTTPVYLALLMYLVCRLLLRRTSA